MSSKTVWYQRDPDSISYDEANDILEDPQNRKLFPNQFSLLLQALSTQIAQLKEQSKRDNPLAWFQPSYEQTLKLNAWIYGITYLVDFDANRIGKTAIGVINALSWILPPDPQWVMFQPYTDQLNRTFQTIPRPPITALKTIRENLHSLDLTGNPKLPYDHPDNLACYKATLHLLATHQPPFPPSAPKRTFWVGGPDNDWNEKNIVKEWKKWTPTHNIVHPYNHTKQMTLGYDQPLNRTYPTATVDIIFKSYDSEDTKWSGGAVDGIMMSEGIPPDIFSELRQRYKYPAFGSWDYTPVDPRNTAGRSALAHKVFTGEEQLPLTPTIFSGFGIESTPDYIMDPEKKADMIKMWANKAEGDARIKGLFYSSSPVVLKNYRPEHHALQLTLQEIRQKYHPRPLLLFRGLDPGWGHVTACAWMALAPDNTRYIYRIYAESQRSIEERCEDIIRLSDNQRILNPTNQKTYIERSTHPDNRIRLTFIDYHTFKTDELTKRPYAYNYINNGLVVRQSITYGPKERGQMLNDLLEPVPHLAHPVTRKTPGGKLFFLINEPGVAEALHKMSNVFYQTYEKGEKRGLTKDTIQDYDDDEMDAVAYVTLPSLNYASYFNNSNSNPNSNPNLVNNTGQTHQSSISFNNIQFLNAGETVSRKSSL